MVKIVDLNLKRQIWIKARPSGKVKVHLEVEAVTTEVVIIEVVSEELVTIVEKKDIDHLNVHMQVRRLVAVEMLWCKKSHRMNLRRKIT
ncbi:hypothetical protein [[Clostridium] innocuum]|nr:hypothetical protein [[Clostridium] innocuum]